MKLFSFLLASQIFLSCGMVKPNPSTRFPEKMPDDFKVVYHLDGGMVNMYRNITLQLGDCSDKGRDEMEGDYAYKWEQKNRKPLEELYTSLKDLNAFTLNYTTEGEVYDRGGESLRFRIDGKDYYVSDAQNSFVTKKDGPAFQKSLTLIINFANAHKK